MVAQLRYKLKLNQSTNILAHGLLISKLILPIIVRNDHRLIYAFIDADSTRRECNNQIEILLMEIQVEVVDFVC